MAPVTNSIYKLLYLARENGIVEISYLDAILNGRQNSSALSSGLIILYFTTAVNPLPEPLLPNSRLKMMQEPDTGSRLTGASTGIPFPIYCLFRHFSSIFMLKGVLRGIFILVEVNAEPTRNNALIRNSSELLLYLQLGKTPDCIILAISLQAGPMIHLRRPLYIPIHSQSFPVSLRILRHLVPSIIPADGIGLFRVFAFRRSCHMEYHHFLRETEN